MIELLWVRANDTVVSPAADAVAKIVFGTTGQVTCSPSEIMAHHALVNVNGFLVSVIYGYCNQEPRERQNGRAFYVVAHERRDVNNPSDELATYLLGGWEYFTPASDDAIARLLERGARFAPTLATIGAVKTYRGRIQANSVMSAIRNGDCKFLVGGDDALTELDLDAFVRENGRCLSNYVERVQEVTDAIASAGVYFPPVVWSYTGPRGELCRIDVDIDATGLLSVADTLPSFDTEHYMRHRLKYAEEYNPTDAATAFRYATALSRAMGIDDVTEDLVVRIKGHLI